ncbi:hypothetical protein VPH35_063888 [Triticum aestivum]
MDGAGGERRWADLPGDILAAVHLIAASAYDRARFATVCTPWRAAAARHRPLPALPLLLLSTGDGRRDREARAYSPEDGRVLRVPLPWFPWGNRLVGSFAGGWIATASGSERLLVVNLFAGARALSARQSAVVCACPRSDWECGEAYQQRITTDQISVRKIVFSEDPSTGGCILAAMTSWCNIALCRVGCPDSGWTTRGCGTNRYSCLVDIAFCNGVLYGFRFHELLRFDIGVNEDGAPVTALVHRLDINMSTLRMSDVSSDINYIFELRGKLAIAVRVWVFELMDDGRTPSSHRFRWAEVMSLGDQALFLGPSCCKAVHVSTANRRGGVEGNRIYYSQKHSSLRDSMECLARLDIGSCTVLSWESEGVHHLERIISQGYFYRKEDGINGCNSSVWLLPPDF